MQAILLQRTQITCVPLSVFLHRHPKASSEIRERPFPFPDGCCVAVQFVEEILSDFLSALEYIVEQRE